MSQSTATRAPAAGAPTKKARPLSPHLTVYRWPITMTMSILHRITGSALYVGTLLVAWWVISASISPAAFEIARSVYGSIIGRLILFGYSWALMHHMVGGMRHLFWDTGAGLEKHVASRIAWGTIAVSVVLTLLIWIGVLFIGGRP